MSAPDKKTSHSDHRNQNLLILSNIAIVPLLTSFGGADAHLFQLYANDILALREKEIGLLIGLVSLIMPLQIFGVYFTRRWGAKPVLVVGFSLLFLLIPLLLLNGFIHGRSPESGLWFLGFIMLSLHAVHNFTKGIAFQPLIHYFTQRRERGWFFTKMRVGINGFNLLFFAVLSLTLGEQMTLAQYGWIIAFLMFYCFVAAVSSYALSTPDGMEIKSANWKGVRHEIKNILTPGYYFLFVVMLLASLSGLPLLTTYLSSGLELSANSISRLITLNIVGLLAGLLIWGRLIDRYGFIGILKIILFFSALLSVAWLLVRPANEGWFAVLPSAMVLGGVVFFVGFFQSGLKMALLVGAHNLVDKSLAVTALALFNTAHMLVVSLVSVGVGYYLHYTMRPWIFDGRFIMVDSYQLLCICGGVLCALAALLCHHKNRIRFFSGKSAYTRHG